MPYLIARRRGQYCVFNERTGENKGCHESWQQAVEHLRALYANEGMDGKALHSAMSRSLLLSVGAKRMQEVEESEAQERQAPSPRGDQASSP